MDFLTDRFRFGVKHLPATLHGLPDRRIFLRGYGSEEAKPNGFVPIVVPGLEKEKVHHQAVCLLYY
jgi:hypothetical protein